MIKKPIRINLDSLKSKVYREVLVRGTVPGVISFDVTDRGRGDGIYCVDRVYDFLGFQARITNCNYETKSEAEKEALVHGIEDLRGRPGNLETKTPGEPLWPNIVEPGEVSRNGTSQKVVVRKYVLGEL